MERRSRGRWTGIRSVAARGGALEMTAAAVGLGSMINPNPKLELEPALLLLEEEEEVPSPNPSAKWLLPIPYEGRGVLGLPVGAPIQDIAIPVLETREEFNSAFRTTSVPVATQDI